MVDGKLKFAISEERLNRIKNWYGNPVKSINLFLKSHNIKLNDIDCVATHGIAIKKKINEKKYINKINKIKLSKLKSLEKKKFNKST